MLILGILTTFSITAKALPLTIIIPSSNISYEVEGEVYIDTTQPVRLVSENGKPMEVNKAGYLKVRTVLDSVFEVSPTYNATEQGRIYINIDGSSFSSLPQNP